MNSSGDLLRRVPFLAELSDDDLDSLARSATRRRFPRGREIFHRDEPGDSLYIIEAGSVRIYLPSSQGSDLTLAVLGEGDFFGDMALLDGGLRSASATALEDTEAIVLDRKDFTHMLTSRPASAMAVLAAVARRLREANEMAGDMAFLDVGGRVAKRLLELAATHGVRRPDGILLNLSLTQEALANMVGVTRESVNRQLSALRQRGVIGREGRRFLIRDEAALRCYIE